MTCVLRLAGRGACTCRDKAGGVTNGAPVKIVRSVRELACILGLTSSDIESSDIGQRMFVYTFASVWCTTSVLVYVMYFLWCRQNSVYMYTEYTKRGMFGGHIFK